MQDGPTNQRGNKISFFNEKEGSGKTQKSHN
jgi:hypothetical protein